MSRHAFSHLRHSSAHFFIIGSSLNLSHSSPHRLHASAHDLQIVSENGRPIAYCHTESYARAIAQALNLQRALLALISNRVRPVHIRSLN